MACPKSPVTNAFYSEHITGTIQSFSCRIIGHTGTYFTVQHVTHINDLTATVTLVTMGRHDRSKSNYAKCFWSFHFRKLLNQYRCNVIILCTSFSYDLMEVDDNLKVWENNKEAYL